jgi:hypothetical protein
MNSSRRTPKKHVGKNTHKLPKSLTANAPFRVRKNVQLLSVPSHNTGLTVRRAVRFNIDYNPTQLNVVLTYENVFARFFAELNITLATPNGRLSFSPEWVNFYSLADSYRTASLRIYDEPRAAGVVNTFVNSPFFDATDSSTESGILSLHAIIPKAATYTMSVDDVAPMKNLPFLSMESDEVSRFVIDVGGTFSLKKTGGIAMKFTYLKL